MRALGLLCALCSVSLCARALDREAFAFTSYELDARIEAEQQRFAVRGKITLRNDSQSPHKDLSLQLSSALDWRTIQLGGKPVQFLSQPYTSDLDYTGTLSEAIVSLPQEVPPKGTVRLEIGYEGTLPLDANRLVRMGVPEAQAKRTDWDQISPSFTAIRGIGHVVWFPIAVDAAFLSDGNSFFDALARWKAREQGAQLKARLTYIRDKSDKGPIMVCAGLAGQKISVQAAKGQSSSMDCSFDEATSGIPVFVVADFEDLVRPSVDIFYLSGHKSAAQDYALATEKAVPFVTDWFGAPRAKAQVLELPEPEDAPFENGALLLTPLIHVDARIAEITAVHQLTHAAFPSPRPWIYEGFAHFAQAAYREQQNGRRSAIDFLAMHRNAVLDAEKAVAAEHTPDTAADESLINTNVEEFYRSKAAYVWWMLRDMLGEPTLKKVLAAYHQDQDKDASYLQHVLTMQTNRDLEWFFNDWVYRDRGLPDFHVDSVYPRPTLQSTYLTTVTIENLGNAGAEVPVTVRFAGGEQTLRLEVHAKSKNSIRFNLPASPQEITVNDGSVPEIDLSNNTFKVEAATK